jgi:hypothetical protein
MVNTISGEFTSPVKLSGSSRHTSPLAITQNLAAPETLAHISGAFKIRRVVDAAVLPFTAAARAA